MSELTVILKDESRTYKQKFLMYTAYAVHEADADVKVCLDEAIKNFQGKPDSVTIKISLEVL